MTAETKACPVCGEQILAVARKCRHCGMYLDPSARPHDVFSAAERAMLPVGRPISAIAAGYCALFSLIPVFGLPFSIAALVCGIVALKKINADSSLSGRGRAWFGIIVGGFMTVVSLIGLAAMIISIAESGWR